MNEFFINRIFVKNQFFYIFIKPWRVPIVKNHCFIRDEITCNVSLKIANWSLIPIRESLFSESKSLIALFYKIGIGFSVFSRCSIKKVDEENFQF